MSDLLSKCSEMPNGSYAISRQAAINEVARWNGYLDDDMIMRIQTGLNRLPSVQPDDDRLERCRFEYVNACKVLAHRTPDTRKKDVDDAYAVVRALYPIFGEEVSW